MDHTVNFLISSSSACSVFIFSAYNVDKEERNSLGDTLASGFHHSTYQELIKREDSTP